MIPKNNRAVRSLNDLREHARALMKRLQHENDRHQLSNPLPLTTVQRQGVTDYQYRGRTLFSKQENGTVTTAHHGAHVAAAIVHQLKKDGVTQFQSQGPNRFQQRLWRYGQTVGLNLTNYHPSPEDHAHAQALRLPPAHTVAPTQAVPDLAAVLKDLPGHEKVAAVLIGLDRSDWDNHLPSSILNGLNPYPREQIEEAVISSWGGDRQSWALQAPRGTRTDPDNLRFRDLMDQKRGRRGAHHSIPSPREGLHPLLERLRLNEPELFQQVTRVVVAHGSDYLPRLIPEHHRDLDALKVHLLQNETAVQSALMRLSGQSRDQIHQQAHDHLWSLPPWEHHRLARGLRTWKDAPAPAVAVDHASAAGEATKGPAASPRPWNLTPNPNPAPLNDLLRTLPEPIAQRGAALLALHGRRAALLVDHQDLVLRPLLSAAADHANAQVYRSGARYLGRTRAQISEGALLAARLSSVGDTDLDSRRLLAVNWGQQDHLHPLRVERLQRLLGDDDVGRTIIADLSTHGPAASKAMLAARLDELRHQPTNRNRLHNAYTLAAELPEPLLEQLLLDHTGQSRAQRRAQDPPHLTVEAGADHPLHVALDMLSAMSPGARQVLAVDLMQQRQEGGELAFTDGFERLPKAVVNAMVHQLQQGKNPADQRFRLHRLYQQETEATRPLPKPPDRGFHKAPTAQAAVLPIQITGRSKAPATHREMQR